MFWLRNFHLCQSLRKDVAYDNKVKLIKKINVASDTIIFRLSTQSRGTPQCVYHVIRYYKGIVLHSHVQLAHSEEMPPKTRSRENARKTKSREDEQADAQGEDSPLGDVGPKVRGKRKASTSEKNVNTKHEEHCGRPQYRHWLMKSEPDSRLENGIDVKFGIEDLKALPNQTGCWDGVRNYQARNFMRDMKEEQQAFFYHSNCKEPGVAGIMKIVKEAYVDHTQFDKKDVHYDASSKTDNPKWSMVDVQFQRMMKRFIPLSELKKYHLQHKVKGGPLKDMALFTRARLSVQPLTTEDFDFVLSLENQEPL